MVVNAKTIGPAARNDSVSSRFGPQLSRLPSVGTRQSSGSRGGLPHPRVQFRPPLRSTATFPAAARAMPTTVSGVQA